MAPHANDSSKEVPNHINSKDHRDSRKSKKTASSGNKIANPRNPKTTTTTINNGYATPSTPSNLRTHRSPMRSPRISLASMYYNNSNNNNSISTPVSVGANSSSSLNFDALVLHKDIERAIQTNQWDSVRVHLQQVSHNSMNSLSLESLDLSERKGPRVSFWNRISSLRVGGGGSTSSANQGSNSHDKSGLLLLDDEQRTPLHLAVTCRKVPIDIIQLMITLESRAVSMPNNNGRLPLHFAIVHRTDLSVIAALIDAFPAAISFPDSKGLSPLQYAFDIAKRDSAKGTPPPRTYWMPLPKFCDEAIWQERQTERWSVVHWLLLSSATHLQTSLSVGGRKPLLVEALLSAASPAVISLLIGASVMLLSHERKATAFAASTLYTCITRHYPLTILMSLANQCPTDVHKVRDETGMGIVAAQYISACYEQVSSTQEWSIAEDFYACFTECIQERDIGDDPVMTDWWRKMEYLIAFCACWKLNKLGIKGGKKKANATRRFDPDNFPSEYLLHAALMNNDTPPPVIRLLLALYPKSLFLEDPKTAALPIHLCSMKLDYISRYYELSSDGNDLTMNILLRADPASVLKRHEGRLPLHYAIESGRTITSLQSLLEETATQSLDIDEFRRVPPLLQRDPKTGLYPFLLAASYPNNSDDDGLRWTCVARNKFSNSAWNALSDREKASNILRVAELDNIARIDTIYELLRRQPDAICDVALREKISNPRRIFTRRASVSLLACDSTGRGVVADHYISWNYLKTMVDSHAETYEDNVKNQELFDRAIVYLRGTGNLSSASREMQIWWETLLIYIRNIYVTKKRQNEKHWINIPEDDNKYLLHVALTNDDTPPQVIEMIIASFPQATSLSVPSTSLLPIHIAAETPTYIPRSFEQKFTSSLCQVIDSYPNGVRIFDHHRLPLHIAIASGKPHQDIDILIRTEPKSLTVRDYSSGLFPFQLKASCASITSVQRSRFLLYARNKFDEVSWNTMTPQMRTKEVVKVQKEHEVDILSSIYILLRSDPSVLSQKAAKLKVEEQTKSNSVVGRASTHTFISKESEDSTFTVKSIRSGDSTSRTVLDDNSFLAKAEQITSPVARTKTPLQLMLLLSQHASRHAVPDDEMFECDASVMSNIDVLSTLTSTAHTTKRDVQNNQEHVVTEETVGFNEKDSSSEDESSVYDFAEDSFVRSYATVSDAASSAEAEGINENSNKEIFAYFELRRTPRGSSGKNQDGSEGNISSVKLIKRSTQLTEINKHSLLRHTPHEKSSVNGSIPSNSMSIHTSSSKHSFSYKSMTSDEKRSQTTESKTIPSRKIRDDDTLSLSLPSSHPRFTPAPLAAASASEGTNLNQKSLEGKSSNENLSTGNLISPDKHEKEQSQKNASSLLGSYGDGDVDDEDPLLNLDPTPDDSKVRAASEHNLQSAKGRHALEKRKTAKRQSSSEHISKTNTKSSNREIMRPSRGSNDARENTLLASSNHSAVKSKTTTDTISMATTTVVLDGKIAIKNRGEVEQNLSKCPAHSETKAPAANGIAAVNSKYFDKATMTWKEREVEHAIKEPLKKLYDFDKVTFRWVVKKMKVSPSPVLEVVSTTITTTTTTTTSSIPVQVANPFSLDMRKSKAVQISKTERHLDIMKTGRTKFQGGSSLSPNQKKQKRRASVNMDQMQSAIHTRNLLNCIVCNVNERKVLLIPCRHLCLCEHCSVKQPYNLNCPLCSGVVSSKIVIA